MSASQREPAPLARPRLVLLDLDGTLADTAPDIAVAANLMLARRGRELVSETRIREFVGDGIDRLVHRCLTGRMHGDAPQPVFAPARALFEAFYAEHNGRHGKLYDGVAEGIARLRAMGIRLGCVTNKSSAFSEPLLARLGLLQTLDPVVSGDSTAHKKPHPDPLLHACARAAVSRADALLVGDSIQDVRAARAAGVPVVCVDYGYNQGRDIRDAGADHVIGSLDALPALIG